MSMFSKLLLGVAVAGCFSFGEARAEVFVWKDGLTNVSVAYPDRWAHVNNQKPNDILTIAAPTNADGSNDFAGCRMRVQDDKRFAIYPVRYSDEIQRVNFSYDFWEDYGREFTNTSLIEVRDNTGLGRGAASMADFMFETVIGPKMIKRGMAFASLYNNRLHIFECSAEANAYPRWVPAFRQILSSVDFAKIVNEAPHGHYRNFLKDKPLTVHSEPDYTF